MSISISIVQEGRRKRTLPLEVLTGNHLAYGSLGEKAFIPGKISDDGITLYDPKAIARGIHVTWSPKENRHIELHVNQPTSPTELDDFFYLIMRINAYWNSSIIFREKKITLEEARQLVEDRKHDNKEILDDTYHRLEELTVLEGKEVRGPTMFAVFNPLTYGIEEARLFSEDNSRFPVWMHELQQRGIVNELPMLCIDEDRPGTLLGVLAIDEGARDTAYPYKPSMSDFSPFALEVGLECSQWEALLLPQDQELPPVRVPYDAFSRWVRNQGKALPFDQSAFVLDPLTFADMLAIEASA